MPHRSLLLAVCTVALALTACGPGEESDGASAGEEESGEADTRTTDQTSSDTSDTSDTTDTTDTTDTSVGSSSDSGDDGNPYPPGCTDGGPGMYARVVGPDQIRISNIPSQCEDPTQPDTQCSWDHYVGFITVPGLASGDYDLSDPGSAGSLAYSLVWDHDQSEAGCFCVADPTGVDVSVTTGIITIAPTSAVGWDYAVTLDNLDGEGGTRSFLVDPPC